MKEINVLMYEGISGERYFSKLDCLKSDRIVKLGEILEDQTWINMNEEEIINLIIDNLDAIKILS